MKGQFVQFYPVTCDSRDNQDKMGIWPMFDILLNRPTLTCER